MSFTWLAIRHTHARTHTHTHTVTSLLRCPGGGISMSSSFCRESRRVSVGPPQVTVLSIALRCSARGVTTDPGLIPGCVAEGHDRETHEAAHNWPSFVRVRGGFGRPGCPCPIAAIGYHEIKTSNKTFKKESRCVKNCFHTDTFTNSIQLFNEKTSHSVMCSYPLVNSWKV
jgi:hypothetical protein